MAPRSDAGREPQSEETVAEVETWEVVREAGRRASGAGSDWRRFGLPLGAVRVFAPGEAPPPKRRLEEIAMSPEARRQLGLTLAAARKLPHVKEPIRVLVGLRIEPAGLPLADRLELLHRRLPSGAVLELAGLVSASTQPPPPLYAAGRHGAMLELRLREGALIGLAEDEGEVLLPMDCRCRVVAPPRAIRYATGDGAALVRPALRLAQLDTFADGHGPGATVAAGPPAVIEPQWDGVTRSATLTARAAEARQALADAARNYDWDRLLALLETNPEAVNSARPDGGSRYAPLHQAAHGGAPLAVIERLLELGAWRTLRNARGERPVDVARARGHEHLLEALEPRYRRRVPAGTLRRIESRFHAVIRERAGRQVEEHALRLPELEPLLETARPSAWFPVPGMYGGFSYRLEGEGGAARLVVESWSRVVGGSGQRHVIDVEGSRLVDQGFV